MQATDYSENILVQESAGHLLERRYVRAGRLPLPTIRNNWARKAPLAGQATGKSCSPGIFGRRCKRLNPWLTPAQLDEAQKKNGAAAFPPPP